MFRCYMCSEKTSTDEMCNINFYKNNKDINLQMFCYNQVFSVCERCNEKILKFVEQEK